MEVKEVKVMAQKGYKNPPVPRRLVGQSHIPPNLYLTHSDFRNFMCQDLGLIVNMEKSELELKQICDYVGYQFDLKEGKVRTTVEHWQILNLKI